MTQLLVTLQDGLKARVRRYLPEEPRLRRARLSTLGTVTTRALNLGARVVSVPLALSLLGPERYGVWLTLGSILGWLSIADLGAPTALINPLSAALAHRDVPAARRLVSSAFVFLLSVGAVVFCACNLAAAWVDLRQVFNTSATVGGDLRWAVHLAVSLAAVSIPLRLSRVVLIAHQREYVTVWTDVSAELAALSGMVLMYATGASLTGFVAAVFGMSVLANGALWARVFTRHAREVRPAFSQADRSAVRRVSGEGLWFLVAFLGDLLIMQTHLIIITHALGPAKVTPYGVTYQLFTFPFFIIFSLVKPLWPAYAEAAARGDVAWIRRTHRRSLVQCVGAMMAVALVNVVAGRLIIHYWAGAAAVPPFALVVAMAGYFPVWMWAAVNGNLVNAIGGIRPRAWVVLLNGLVNLSVSLVLVRKLGLVGVSLGALAAMVLTEGIMMPLLVRRYLHRVKAADAPGSPKVPVPPPTSPEELAGEGPSPLV